MKTKLFILTATGSLALAAVLISIGTYKADVIPLSNADRPIPKRAAEGGVAATVPLPGKSNVAEDAESTADASASSPIVTEAVRLAGIPASQSRSRSITDFVTRLGSADCAVLATQANLIGEELSSAALQRWVELDPQAAIRRVALAAKSEVERVGHLSWMLRDFSASEPAKALDWVQGNAELRDSERAAAMAAVLPEYARQVDSERALDLLRQLPSSIAAAAAGEIFAKLAEGTAPDAARAVFSRAGSLHGTARFAAMRSVLDAFAGQNMQTAIDLWGSVQEIGTRNELTARLAQKLGESFTPVDVVNWLYTYAPERGADSAKTEAFAALAAQDPTQADAFLQTRSPGQQNDLKEAVASTLEPNAALRMAGTITDASRRERAIAEAATRLADSDPQALRELIANSKDEAVVRNMLPATVNALLAENRDAAIQFVKNLPAATRDSAAHRLSEGLGDNDPVQAISIATATIADPEVRVGAIGSALSKLADDSPTPSIPNIKWRDTAERDQALAYAAARSSVRNPDGALAMANMISDVALRSTSVQQAVLGAAQSYSAQDTLQLLEKTNLSAELKSTIRKQITP